MTRKPSSRSQPARAAASKVAASTVAASKAATGKVASKKPAAKKPASKKSEPKQAASGKAAIKKIAPKKSAVRSAKALDAKAIEEVFHRFWTIEPEPKGELEHVNAYTLLVAVVLSAQATDAGVNKATRDLFKRVDTPEKMVALGEDKLRDQIKTIGLFRTKAKNVIALSEALIRHHHSQVPEDRDALQALPGVGRKTANVVLNMAFGHPTMAVDTHVFRVSNRIPLAIGKTPEAVEAGLEKIIPARYALHAHHWLILHGRYLCKARVPKCWRCPVADLCRFEPKSQPRG